MSSCLKGGGGADFHGGGSDSGRTCPVQLGGHRIIKTFWETQSTSGLWRVSQECPMITVCCPRFATARCALLEWHPKRRVTWTSSMTDPFSFGEPSTLRMRTGWGSGVVSSWCFCMKLQLETTPLPQPVLIRNVDGSPNENGSVMEEVHVTLRFGCHSKRAHLAVANLGQQTVIIGHSWLTLHNPEVDWVSQKVLMMRCPPSCTGHVLPESDPPP